MSKENKKEEIEDAFAKGIDELNELRGKVKAFILLASTDEPSEEKENAVKGILEDLVKLFENIPTDIKSAAEIKGLLDILGKVFGENEESESEKKDGEK